MDWIRWKIREFPMYRMEHSRNGSGTVYGLVLECNQHYNTFGATTHSCRALIPNKTHLATNQKVIWPPIKKYWFSGFGTTRIVFSVAKLPIGQFLSNYKNMLVHHHGIEVKYVPSYIWLISKIKCTEPGDSRFGSCTPTDAWNVPSANSDVELRFVCQ